MNKIKSGFGKIEKEKNVKKWKMKKKMNEEEGDEIIWKKWIEKSEWNGRGNIVLR